MQILFCAMQATLLAVPSAAVVAAASQPAKELNALKLATNSSIEFEPQDTPARLGRGYDSVTNTVKPKNCVLYNDTPGEVATFTNSDGKMNALTFTHADDDRKERAALQISGSAALNIGLGHAKGSASYYSEHSLSAYRETLIVNIVLVKQTVSLKKIVLDSEASALLYGQPASGNKPAVPPNYPAFRRLCGDSFIIGYTQGAEYRLAYDSVTDDQSEQQEIKTTFEAAYIGSSLKADTASAFDTELKDHKLSVTELTKGPNPPPQWDSASILTYYRTTLPQAVADGHGWTISAMTAEYPAGDGGLNSKQSYEVDRLSEYIGNLYRFKNSLVYIQHHLALFPDTNSKELASDIKDTDDRVEAATLAADNCVSDAPRCDLKSVIQEIPNVPDRIVWQKVDVTSPAPICHVNNLDHNEIARIEGEWSAWPGPPNPDSNKWFLPGQNDELVVWNRNTGDPPRKLNASRDQILHPGDEICYKVLDDPAQYGDNRSGSAGGRTDLALGTFSPYNVIVKRTK